MICSGFFLLARPTFFQMWEVGFFGMCRSGGVGTCSAVVQIEMDELLRLGSDQWLCVVYVRLLFHR